MKRSRWFIALSVSTAALLVVALFWRGTVSRAEAPGPTAFASPDTVRIGAAEVEFPVVGVRAIRGTLTLPVTAAGEAVAWREAVLPAPQAGQVVRLPVRENDAVAAGQELAALDATELRMAVREAEAGLEEARARFREMMLFADRIADEAVRAERERMARVRSGLGAAEVRVERARLNLSRSVVRAPFAGRAASIEAESGEWVGAGAPLMRVVDTDPIRVEVQVLDGELRWLRPGSGAEVRFPAYPDEVFAGEVASVNPIVEPELRAARVTVLVPNPGARLLPGMYARVTLAGQRFEDRLLVPRAAVLERDRRAMVFVYDGDERPARAKWTYVTLGRGNDEVVELLESADSGTVAPGDVVLTDGHASLVHDARVRLVDRGGTPAGPARE